MRLEAFQESLSEMIRAHNLPHIEVLDTIEQTMSDVLTSRYPGEKVWVRINEDTLDIDIQAFSMLGGGEWRDIPLNAMTGVKNLHRHIENALSRANVLNQVRRIRKHLQEIRQGVITHIQPDGTLYVEVEILNDGSLLTGVCPPDCQPVSERGRYRSGEQKYFHLRNCRPMMIASTPRCKVTLDRTSRNLPLVLLQQYLALNNLNTPIHCPSRRPGECTEIWAQDRLPREIIIKVQKELGEKIFVLVGRDRQEICKRKSRRYRRNERRTKQKERELQCFKPS